MSIICKICGKECKSNEGISNHIRYYHIKRGDIVSLELYYNQYISPNSVNICDNKGCDTPTKFISVVKGYERHCSHKCSCENPAVRKVKAANTKSAMLAKYGVDNISKVGGNTEKVKATKLQRYGDANYNNSEKSLATNLENHNGVFSTATDEYKEKYKKTVKEKYGVAHHTQSETVKMTAISTNLSKYGVEWSQQLPEIKKRSMDTSEQKYGGTLHGSPSISEQIKKTNLERYGVEHPLQNSEILAKVQQTNLERYGTISPLQNKQLLQNLYGVDDINQLAWVVTKQKDNRKQSLLSKYNVENISDTL